MTNSQSVFSQSLKLSQASCWCLRKAESSVFLLLFFLDSWSFSLLRRNSPGLLVLCFYLRQENPYTLGGFCMFFFCIHQHQKCWVWMTVSVTHGMIPCEFQIKLARKTAWWCNSSSWSTTAQTAIQLCDAVPESFLLNHFRVLLLIIFERQIEYFIYKFEQP